MESVTGPWVAEGLHGACPSLLRAVAVAPRRSGQKRAFKPFHPEPKRTLGSHVPVPVRG